MQHWTISIRDARSCGSCCRCNKASELRGGQHNSGIVQVSVEMGGRPSKAAHRDAGAFDVEEEELDDQPGCCGCFAKGVSISQSPCIYISGAALHQTVSIAISEKLMLLTCADPHIHGVAVPAGHHRTLCGAPS